MVDLYKDYTDRAAYSRSYGYSMAKKQRALREEHEKKARERHSSENSNKSSQHDANHKMLSKMRSEGIKEHEHPYWKEK